MQSFILVIKLAFFKLRFGKFWKLSVTFSHVKVNYILTIIVELFDFQ